jgi:hypothetical protein
MGSTIYELYHIFIPLIDVGYYTITSCILIHLRESTHHSPAHVRRNPPMLSARVTIKVTIVHTRVIVKHRGRRARGSSGLPLTCFPILWWMTLHLIRNPLTRTTCMAPTLMWKQSLCLNPMHVMTVPVNSQYALCPIISS